MELETKTGKKVVSELNAKDVFKSIEQDKSSKTKN
jgi:hypothetical protein